jgi:methylmalonyl-CoA mutase
MGTTYQGGKILKKGLYYEHKKHDGSLPLVGANTFLPKEHVGEVVTEIELISSTEEEKGQQIENVRGWHQSRNVLAPVGETEHGHVVEDAAAAATEPHDRQGVSAEDGAGAQERVCGVDGSGEDALLGQISHALYDVGGEYRRNM